MTLSVSGYRHTVMSILSRTRKDIGKSVDCIFGSSNHTIQWIVSTIVFFSLVLIYLSNGAYIWAGDTYPTSAFVLNALFMKTPYFDRLSSLVFGTEIPYFFQRNLEGHLVSSYPIGSTVFYLPFHGIIGTYQWLISGFCNPLSDVSNFESCRLLDDKVTSAIAAAFQGVLFLRLSGHYLEKPSTRFWCTAFFVLGTDTFVVTAHTNFQHAPTIILLILGWLALKRVEVSENRSGRSAFSNYWLIGFLLGFMISVRPSSLLFAPAFVLALYYARSCFVSASSFIIGFSCGSFGLLWNLINFGTLLGGRYDAVVKHDFVFSLRQLIEGFLGLTLSPGRGLLIYTPVVIIALIGVVSSGRRIFADRTLRLLLLSSAAIFLMYGFYTIWGGGWSFGPRFLVDVMPVWMITAGMTVEDFERTAKQRSNARPLWLQRAFVLLGLFGIANQVAGAFGANGTYAGFQWDFYGYRDEYEARYWQLQDSPLQRDYVAMFNKIVWPKAFYGHVVDGRACLLRNSNDPARPALSVLEYGHYREKVFAVNLGKTPWVGVSGGAPLPPSIVFDSVKARRSFVLEDGFVRPGAVGSFRDFEPNPTTENESPSASFLIGGRPQTLGCNQ